MEWEEKEVYLIIVDYSKAFDTVHHRMLFETMIEMGIPYHLVQLIEGLYINQEAAVRWNGQLTDWFQIGQGTRQGCNVSPTEFNIYGENIIRRVEEKNKRGAVIGGRRMTNLRYADDTTIISSSASGIRKYFQDLVTESKYYNMEINATKTKVMVVSRQEGVQLEVNHGGQQLEQVQSFKFLGSYKTATGDCTKDIKIRAALARQKATELINIWKDRNINTVLKVRVMKQMVWAVFLHGAEGWTIKKSDKNRIEALEMWCWRKMLGVSWREHRTNKSILEELDVERELMAKVVKLKLQYFGHVARGSAGQLALTVLEGSMEGTRYQGKPRRQWLNDIEDWTGYKYIQLKEMSVDREQWRKKTREWSAAVANPRRRKAD